MNVLKVQDSSAVKQEVALSAHTKPQPQRMVAERRYSAYIQEGALGEDIEGRKKFAHVRKAPRYLTVSSHASLEEQ